MRSDHVSCLIPGALRRRFGGFLLARQATNALVGGNRHHDRGFLLASVAFVCLAKSESAGTAVAFNVMLIGGCRRLLFNGNPLLRFDERDFVPRNLRTAIIFSNTVPVRGWVAL